MNDKQKIFVIIGVVTLVYLFVGMTTSFEGNDEEPEIFSLIIGCIIGYFLFKDKPTPPKDKPTPPKDESKAQKRKEIENMLRRKSSR